VDAGGQVADPGLGWVSKVPVQQMPPGQWRTGPRARRRMRRARSGMKSRGRRSRWACRSGPEDPVEGRDVDGGGGVKPGQRSGEDS
jgi:hypothetical protein